MKDVKFKKSTFDIGPLQIECINVKCTKCNVFAHIGCDQKISDIKCPVCKCSMEIDKESDHICRKKNIKK